MLTIYNKNLKKQYMSEEEKNSENSENEELMQERESDGGSAMELGYLTTAILDYYETTATEGFDEGEGWKAGSEHDKRKKGVEIPADLNAEIKKAFIVQIKKFQK